jgi:hypothetical protein
VPADQMLFLDARQERATESEAAEEAVEELPF